MSNQVNQADYIPKKEKIFYGMAEIYGGGSAALISVCLLYYLNSMLGIASAVCSTIIMVSKAWDAISDPLMGVIADNTRSKFGRRKPYIVAGGVLTLVAMLLLFAPVQNLSAGWKVTYVAFAYIFFCTANTVSQVPYCSLSSEISQDYKQRNSANSVKLIFSMVSAGFCFLVPTLVLEMYKDGKITSSVFYLIIGLGFGIFFATPLILAGIFSKERVPFNPDEKARFSFKSYTIPFKVKSYKYHILMYIGAFLCSDIIAALAVYYATDCLHDVEIFGMKMSSLFIIAPLMVMAALAIPLALYVSRKVSKQRAFVMGFPFYIVGALILSVAPITSENSWIVPVAAAMMGIGFGGAQCMPWMIFPDTVDVAELTLGERHAGAFSGMMTFSRKLSSAIAIGLVGVVLSLFKYKESEVGQDYVPQPESALIAIRVLIIVSVVLLIGLASYAGFRYKVTDKKLERVRYFLEIQRKGETDLLSDEEKEERLSLIKELGKNIPTVENKKDNEVTNG